MATRFINYVLLAASLFAVQPAFAAAKEAATPAAKKEAAAPAAISKIGVVNLIEILQTTPEAKAIHTKLEQEFKVRQEELVALQKKLQKNVEQYQRDEAVMAEKEKKTLGETIQKQQQELQKNQFEGQQDYNRREQEESQAFLSKLKTAVEALATKEQYQLILRSDMVAFGQEGMDVTQQVMKIYREQNK
jgi:outer membrane protein